MAKERIAEFDLMKGLGILLMVVCHRLPEVTSLYDWIHTFHMPLFVFISGYLFRPRSFRQLVERSAKRLLLPFSVVFLLFLLADGNSRTLHVQSLLSSNPPLWVVWFLPSLFVTQILAGFTFGHRSLQLVALLFGLGATFLFESLQLPFYLWQGCFMYPFFWVGSQLSQHHCLASLDNRPRAILLVVVSVLVWGIAFLFESGPLRLAVCRANWWVAGDIVVALAACLVLFLVCRLIAQQQMFRWLKISLSWIGGMSMVVMCLHALDHFLLSGFPWVGVYWRYASFLGSHAWGVGYLAVEIPLLAVLTWVVVHVKPLRIVFGVE